MKAYLMILALLISLNPGCGNDNKAVERFTGMADNILQERLIDTLFERYTETVVRGWTFNAKYGDWYETNPNKIYDDIHNLFWGKGDYNYGYFFYCMTLWQTTEAWLEENWIYGIDYMLTKERLVSETDRAEFLVLMDMTTHYMNAREPSVMEGIRYEISMEKKGLSWKISAIDSDYPPFIAMVDEGWLQSYDDKISKREEAYFKAQTEGEILAGLLKTGFLADKFPMVH